MFKCIVMNHWGFGVFRHHTPSSKWPSLWWSGPSLRPVSKLSTLPPWFSSLNPQPLWCPLCPVSEAVDGSSPPFPFTPSRLKAINRDGAAMLLHPTSTGKHFALKLPCQHSMTSPSYLVSFLSNVSSKWSPVISSMTGFTELGRTRTTSSLRVLLAADGGTWAAFQDWPSAPSLLLGPASWYQWRLHWYCPSPSVLMQQMLCSRVPCYEQSRQWLMDREAHHFT